MDMVSYILSKSYTKKSLDGMGALRGSPATIKSIEHKDGVNKVTFEWTAISGTKYEQVMEVYDGTPIYVWEAGNTYKYGDLVIYSSQFYRCIVENSDSTFNETHWNGIDSPDGNYDIVEDSTLLPTRFTAADRKMYYSIDDQCFYLWDGTKWSEQYPKCITKPTTAEINAAIANIWGA